MSKLYALSELEESLWQQRHTCDHVLANATQMELHNNFYKQLMAFQKLADAALAKYLGEELYRMLMYIVGDIPFYSRGRIARTQYNTAEINSIVKLKVLIFSLKDTERSRFSEEELEDVDVYFSTFYKDLNYLRKLKQYFDERIYKYLYQYFYNPAIYMEDDLPYDSAEPDGYQSSLPSEAKSRSDAIEISVNKNLLIETDKLSEAVISLDDINRKWGRLLEEAEILDIADYERKHQDEMDDLREKTNFELILYLVPDILMKSLRSLELAKTWWIQANKIFKDFPANCANPQDNKRRQLEERITSLAEQIEQERRVVQQYCAESRRLESKESRFVSLEVDCENIKEMKRGAKQKYRETLSERRLAVSRVAHARKQTAEYFRLKSKLKDLDGKVLDCYNDTRLLDYVFALLQDDYDIEMEVRPNFIRFAKHVQDMIEKTEQLLQEKKDEKRKLEKELALFKANEHISSARDERDQWPLSAVNREFQEGYQQDEFQVKSSRHEISPPGSPRQVLDEPRISVIRHRWEQHEPGSQGRGESCDQGRPLCRDVIRMEAVQKTRGKSKLPKPVIPRRN